MEFSWWFWALTGVLPSILFLLIYNGVIARRRRTLERLQQRWGWLGSPEPHHKAGRAWRGEVEGRSVQVTWFEHNTEIALDARPHTKVGFGRAGQPEELAAVDGGTRVELDGKVGYGPDPHAVRAIDAYPGADEALTTLLGRDERDKSLRAVGVDPGGRVTWFARNLPEREVTREDARRWIDALLVVARASEQAPV